MNKQFNHIFFLLFIANPFAQYLKTLDVGGKTFKYYDLPSLAGAKYGK